MKIEKKLFEKWANLYLHGDFEKIRQQMPEDKRVSNELIRVCVKKGEYLNPNVFEAVKTFYQAREKEMKGLAKGS